MASEKIEAAIDDLESSFRIAGKTGNGSRLSMNPPDTPQKPD